MELLLLWRKDGSLPQSLQLFPIGNVRVTSLCRDFNMLRDVWGEGAVHIGGGGIP